jgi:hypothetical protein
MEDFKNHLLTVLDEIRGSGSFVSNNAKSFVFPGLTIRGVEEIGFPINVVQVKEMIKTAHKAPFGKGSETVLDTTVRSAWEIDAGEIEFRNKDWGKFVEKVIEQIKPDLGIEGYSVTAHLYKLLIYEKGDFFVAHKDSEKEKGMFGTLIIVLPSGHSGGELCVRFDGRKEIIDFSEAVNQYKIPFAAFYADCEHEIRPITSGYRVCLVYNLIQNKSGEKIEHNPISEYAQRLAAILKTGEDDKDMLKVVLLGHQYTPENFTMEALKLNDRPKAEALIQAAKKAGFYYKFGLVTSYQMGELEFDSGRNSRRRGYYYDDDDHYDDEDLEDGTMGEVYDEHIDIEHWMADGVPPLRNIKVEKENLISSLTLNEDDPIEKEAEGYTGNAGMEMHYWYHYGALFLWPGKYHYDLLITLDTDNKLEWIDYYNKHWNSLDKADIKLVRQLAESCITSNGREQKTDFAPMVDWLINMNYQEYLPEKATVLLTTHFDQITVEGWARLFEKYPHSYFENIFATAADTGKPATIRLILNILNNLPANSEPFVLQQLNRMPACLNLLNLTDKGAQSASKNILQNILIAGKNKAGDNAWLNNITDALTKNLTREYVNDVLMAETKAFDEKTALAEQIIAVCRNDLKRRVNDKPQPPADWSRSVPDTSGNKRIWDVLRDFLQSPAQQFFDYKNLQAQRKDMEETIRHTTIDLRMETIRKGSPHTLRLIKTQAAYERELAKWKIDVGLLEKAEEW